MCVCVWQGGGGQINKWAIYMDVLSLHDEISTALLYGERARAMYDIDSRCVNMLPVMGPRVVVHFSSLYLHTIVTNVCIWLNGVFLHTSSR